MRWLLVALSLVVVTGVVAIGLMHKPAPPYVPPSTSWGEPDLRGTYTSDGYLGIPFERPSWLGDRGNLTDAEFKESQRANQQQIARDNGPEQPLGKDPLENGYPTHWFERGTRVPSATAMLVDPPNGHIPPLTPEGQRRRDDARWRAAHGSFDSAEQHSYFNRCITRGVIASMLPDISGGSGTNVLQGPGVVVIRNEMIHEARLVPIDSTAPRLGRKIHLYMGDPRGHWEGHTLVVDSTNFTDKLGVGGGTVTSTSLHLVERFTRTAADTIRYEFTVDDPDTYTAKWTAALELISTPRYEIFEFACHEGNYALRNMLSAPR